VSRTEWREHRQGHGEGADHRLLVRTTEKRENMEGDGGCACHRLLVHSAGNCLWVMRQSGD